MRKQMSSSFNSRIMVGTMAIQHVFKEKKLGMGIFPQLLKEIFSSLSKQLLRVHEFQDFSFTM
jgi:hypothetical protein